MKFALYLTGFVVLALIIPFLVPFSAKPDGVDPNQNLPWQVATDEQGGSAVFGLRPGVSTLADVKARLGGEVDVAIIASPGEVGALEGYYGQVALGFVLAKLVVTLDTSPADVAAMRERALKAKHMESTTRKITLHPDDLVRAEQFTVRAISVIPTVNLDESTVIQRFGQPGERIAVSDKRVHLLYPKQGVDVVIDSEGKELLQYVAPRDFAVLREPLVAEQGGKTVTP